VSWFPPPTTKYLTKSDGILWLESVPPLWVCVFLLATSQETTYMFQKFIDFTDYYYGIVFCLSEIFLQKESFLKSSHCSNLAVPIVFLAQKFVDIVHASKLFGKYQGFVILYPAVITCIHIESAILIDVWKFYSLNEVWTSTCSVLTWFRRNCFIRT